MQSMLSLRDITVGSDLMSKDKKEKKRKKRMKKLPEQEIIVTQTIESKIDSRTLISLKTIINSFVVFS